MLRAILVSAVLTTVIGCAGTAPPPDAGAGRPPTEPAGRQPAPAEAPEMTGEEPDTLRDEILAAALERVIDDPAAHESLHLFTECRRDAGLGSVEIFGNGVAIWNGRRQFEVGPAEIGAILAAFREADFAAMPETYGGKKKGPLSPPRPGEQEDGAAALRVICRVEITIDGRSKRVAQLDEGEQSPALRELSEEFFRVSEEPARAGIGADSLADGLEKVARGELAPETLHLLLHRKPELHEPVSGEGFLLRLDGLRASTRLFEAASGYAAPVELRLGPGELDALARDLAGGDLEALPGNLWAPDYTDFSVQVLDRKKSLQARRFAGMEPTAHGTRQLEFDRIYELLEGLHRRVLAEGRQVGD